MVLEPDESGLAGDPGDAGGAASSSCVPLMGVPSPSLFRRMEGRGDPGTVFSPASPAGAGTGVILAGCTTLVTAGRVVMVTLLLCF